ncbi:MAG TPA: tripartite tricarboxylate transporter substrate-binding protein [Candidatus Udaeobacter sp.]|jgi:tripartite-type tricarboxylate transporter receptor subunit TctC|nr:tripartite tricarboxylate transporter substrate-binding protein [Candidatus Udaeobacter sp.]
MIRRLVIPIALSFFVVLTQVGIVEHAFAQANYYEGKTVRFIVGFSAGGGYDAYTRTIARHMGKHVPGSPVFVVDNMAGAGSLIAANYVYKAAKPDGLTIGHFIGGLFLQQLLGKAGVEFDSLKFEYIGVPAQDHFILGIAKSAGITDPDKWIASKQVVKFGGVATGSGTDDFPNLLKATIGLPIQMVSGYKGTADIRLAFNSGEIAGVSNSWESTKSTWKKELEIGDLIPILAATSKPHPELPKLPLAISFAKTDEAKKLIQTVERVHGASVRPYVVTPGTPKERVQILRKAFMDTMKDPAFLAEAQKANLDINADGGAGLEQNVRDIFKLEPALIAKLKEVLK